MSTTPRHRTNRSEPSRRSVRRTVAVLGGLTAALAVPLAVHAAGAQTARTVARSTHTAAAKTTHSVTTARTVRPVKPVRPRPSVSTAPPHVPVAPTTSVPPSTSGAPPVGVAPAPPVSSGQTLHFTANGNWSGSTYVPGAYGFNLADVGSKAQLDQLPSGDKGLAWVGTCTGADSTFTALVDSYKGDPKLFGFYLYDEPDPTGQWSTLCPQANLKAESDYVHANLPGAKTFIILMNMSSSASPSYTGTYNPANSDIDLYGLDPYPCRTELNGCDDTYITKGVAAAKAWGIPQSAIVPVFQTFGGGNWVDDGGGSYLLPSAAQESAILQTWASVVPSPVFDYDYSWGTQNGDTALGSVTALQQIAQAHNATAG
jgi:hypothetical protein